MDLLYLSLDYDIYLPVARAFNKLLPLSFQLVLHTYLINTVLCPIKVNINTIELKVYTSCYCA